MPTEYPDFNDEDVVKRLAKLLAAEIEEIKARRTVERNTVPEVLRPLVEREMRELLERPQPTEEERQEQQQADCKLAREGDVWPLTWHLLARHPNDASIQTAVELLRATYRKRTRQDGRPRLTDAERRKQNPIHNAAEDADILIEILKRLYPDRKVGKIKDMACYVAEVLHPKVDFNALRNYVDLPEDHPRRSSRPLFDLE